MATFANLLLLLLVCLGEFTFFFFFFLIFIYQFTNLKQREAQSARAESTHKGVHFRMYLWWSLCTYIYTHARRELPYATQVFVAVLVLRISSAN